MLSASVHDLCFLTGICIMHAVLPPVYNPPASTLKVSAILSLLPKPCDSTFLAARAVAWHLLKNRFCSLRLFLIHAFAHASFCSQKLLLIQAFAHTSLCSYKLCKCRVQSSSKPWTGFSAPILVESMLYCWCMCQQHFPNAPHPPSPHPCPVSYSPLHVRLKLSLGIRLPWRKQWLMTQTLSWQTLLCI